jgi:hypothetical protein
VSYFWPSVALLAKSYRFEEALFRRVEPPMRLDNICTTARRPPDEYYYLQCVKIVEFNDLLRI